MLASCINGVTEANIGAGNFKERKKQIARNKNK
jgi:hypothetical protein